MFAPNVPDFDNGNLYERRSASLHYDFETAQHRRTVARRWHGAARAAGVIIGVLAAGTWAYGEIGHPPGDDVVRAIVVEGAAVAIASRGQRMAVDEARHQAEIMNETAAEQYTLAEQSGVPAQAWAANRMALEATQPDFGPASLPAQGHIQAQ